MPEKTDIHGKRVLVSHSQASRGGLVTDMQTGRVTSIPRPAPAPPTPIRKIGKH